ncbi:MAG: NmrA family protein [Candidatus Saccharibacteria bacterium]|nr:NmrA family protein [Candidatus Saccharibacteria bacterium]
MRLLSYCAGIETDIQFAYASHVAYHTVMHITVFGANGKVGRLVVKTALGHGHSVTAFVHSNSSFSHHPHLTIYRGDIHNPQSVSKAISGADAVVSTLGSWHAPRKDILSSGMQTIIPAMQQYGVRRIVSLTGADARMSGDEMSRWHRITHACLFLFARKVLRDAEEHIRLLQASHLDWTVIRSPVMIEFGDPKKYFLDTLRPMPWHTIHRKSVVESIIMEIEQPSASSTAPYICRAHH